MSANEPTPWTDERTLMTRQYNYIVEAYDCQLLERHLRRIVEAYDDRHLSFTGLQDLLREVQAAKEFLK